MVLIMLSSSSADPDRELVLALLGAAAQVEKRFDRALSGIKGISFSEYQILRALGDEGGAPTTRVELARMVGLTPSGVTRALKPLEKLGFVRTVRDARDARRSLACLTPDGVELVSDAAGVVDDVIAALPLVNLMRESDRTRVLDLFRALTHG
jgi:DNA-binding MarR family transcriptional regulator